MTADPPAPATRSTEPAPDPWRILQRVGQVLTAAFILATILAFWTGADSIGFIIAALAILFLVLTLLVGPERRDWAVVVAIVVGVGTLLTALAFASGQSRPGIYLAGVLLTILVYAIFATGLNLQFGFTGLINFGHVAFFALGAYGVAVFARRRPACRDVPSTEFPGWLDWVCPGDAHLTWIVPDGWGGALALGLGIGVAFLAAGIFAALIGIPTLKLREDYLAIVTIGSAEIVRIILLNERWLAGGNPGDSLGGANGISQYPRPWFSAITGNEAWLALARDLTTNAYYIFNVLLAFTLLAIVIGVLTVLIKSPWGRVLKAVREDEEVAKALGKNVFRYKMQSLILGAFIAAIGGMAWAWYVSPVNPESFLPILTFYAWIILIIGGSGNIRGPIVGSAILWGIFETARLLPRALPAAASGIPFLDTLQKPAGQIFLIGVLLVLAMVFRPQGILGKREEMILAK